MENGCEIYSEWVCVCDIVYKIYKQKQGDASVSVWWRSRFPCFVELRKHVFRGDDEKSQSW